MIKKIAIAIGVTAAIVWALSNPIEAGTMIHDFGAHTIDFVKAVVGNNG